MRINSCYFLIYGFVIASLTVFVEKQDLLAQTKQNAAWWEQTNQRIRDIYDRGVLNSSRLQIEWLPDSTGYAIRHDSKKGNAKHQAFDVATGEFNEGAVLPGPVNRLLSPQGDHVLQYQGHNLNLKNRSTGKVMPLLESPPDREIFFRSPQWSPDGRYVLFTESDESEIRQRPLLLPTDPSYPELQWQRFARVGEKIPRLRVGVINVANQQTIWLPLDTADAGIYLGQVEWAGNSHEILVERLSRFRDQRSFLLFHLDSEKTEIKFATTQIFNETNGAWAISSQQKNLGLIWLKDGQQFIVISEQDGWRHAFLHDRDGQQLAVLTPGEYDIIDRAVADEKNGWFYFYASPQNATQKYLYRVPLDGTGLLKRITPDDQPGTHEYQFSPDCQYAIHTCSRFDTPPKTDLVKLPEHTAVRTLQENTDLKQRAAAWISQPTEFLQLKISDSVTADAWLIKPRNFDPTKKYPVFVYVYGEPHLQTVLDHWGAAQSHFHRVIADLGYLVVSIDNRGTPAPKGADWRRAIFGSLGPLSTEEQVAALKELGRTREYVDLSRVGIWGWSGGGSNTLNAMFRQPQDYHVGIAVVPKPQPHLYNAWFQEIYMHTREVNAAGYEQSAPLNYAEGLQGDLLIVTGSGETNTHIQIIEGLVDRLIELGKPFDYTVYPNRDHGLQEGAGSVVHVRMLIIRYLLEHLPAGPV